MNGQSVPLAEAEPSRSSTSVLVVPLEPKGIVSVGLLVRATISKIRQQARSARAKGVAVPTDFEQELDRTLRVLTHKEQYAVWNYHRIREKAAEAGDVLPPAGDADLPHAVKALAERAAYAAPHYSILSRHAAHIYALLVAVRLALAMISDERDEAEINR